MQRLRKISYNQSQNAQNCSIVQSSFEARERYVQMLMRIKSQPILKKETYIEKKKQTYDDIKFIPEVFLSVQQMNRNPLQLFSQFQESYREFGAVKICTPPQWKPKFSFKYSQKLISTRIQKINQLRQGKAFESNYLAYTINQFSNLAQNYQKYSKEKICKKKDFPTQELWAENQYWGIVNSKPDNKKCQTSVQYAADLPADQYGSGFPQYKTRLADQNFSYQNNLFNLNNLYKSPGSLLEFLQKDNEKISGITVPWLYIAMQFSSFCWHVEDLWLNSINYSHKGKTKIWYIIPQQYKQKFDRFIFLKTRDRKLLNSLNFMIDPLQLLENGIKVYKVYQKPGDYILTFFNAYHCGFSIGYNVGQAVNFVMIDSLRVINQALYSISNNLNYYNPPVFSYQWLIVSNLNNTQVKQQIILAEYRRIVYQQYTNLNEIVKNKRIIGMKYIDNKMKYYTLACVDCNFYQYLSTLMCEYCKKIYCLNCLNKLSNCCQNGFLLLTRQGDNWRNRCLALVHNYIK